MATLARALQTLLWQVNTAWPHRSKSDDGWIGDAAHQQRKSDHNPDSAGVVHALDITDDPGAGMDADKLVASIITSRDPRISYVIHDRKITAGPLGPQPWVARPYTGANPHTKHMHVSVRTNPYAADPAAWVLPSRALTLTPVDKAWGTSIPIGTILKPGHHLDSPGGRLILQADGNLVLYRPDGHAVWSTDPARGQEVRFQADGNLVMYRDGQAVWQSNTPALTRGGQLILQTDGNLVLYLDQARWNSGTPAA